MVTVDAKSSKKPAKTKPDVQKQRANVYLMMLIVSFVALVLASVLLYLELERYKFDYRAKEAKPVALLSAPAVQLVIDAPGGFGGAIV